MINLEETFDFYGEEYLPEMQEETFRIDNDQKAEWAVNKIRKATYERDRIVNAAQQEIERYKKIIESANERCENNTKGLYSMLRVFFIIVSDDGLTKKTKTQETYKLPSAKIKFKPSVPKIVHDDAALITEFPTFVENVPKLKWAELKKTLKIDGDVVIDTATGEIVEGCAVVNTEETFEVE